MFGQSMKLFLPAFFLLTVLLIVILLSQGSALLPFLYTQF